MTRVLVVDDEPSILRALGNRGLALASRTARA